jgi:YD repeat-containing protein
MGRIVGSTQSGYPAMTYAYNLADALTSFTFPSGRQQMITYDSGNRALGTTGMVPGVPTTYASGLTYWPNGALQQITTGATAVAAVQQFCQNNLLQIMGVRVGSAPLTRFTTNSGCMAPTFPSGDMMFLGPWMQRMERKPSSVTQQTESGSSTLLGKSGRVQSKP